MNCLSVPLQLACPAASPARASLPARVLAAVVLERPSWEPRVTFPPRSDAAGSRSSPVGTVSGASRRRAPPRQAAGALRVCCAADEEQRPAEGRGPGRGPPGRRPQGVPPEDPAVGAGHSRPHAAGGRGPQRAAEENAEDPGRGTRARGRRPRRRRRRPRRPGGGRRRRPQAEGADAFHRAADGGQAGGQSEVDQGAQELYPGHQPCAGQEAGGVPAPGSQGQRGQGGGGEDQGGPGGGGRHRGAGVAPQDSRAPAPGTRPPWDLGSGLLACRRQTDSLWGGQGSGCRGTATRGLQAAWAPVGSGGG